MGEVATVVATAISTSMVNSGLDSTPSSSPTFRTNELHPQQERAEDGVEADELGGDGRGEERQAQPGDRVLAGGGRRRRPHQPGGEGADHQEGERHERRAEPQGDQDALRLGADHAHQQGQQAPGGDVVDGRAGERHHPDLGRLHAAIGEDARQHREGGDRHRHAHEEREDAERDPGGARVG
jgi:hypothetical protein